MWKILDCNGEPFRWEFYSRLAARQFAANMGRPDWKVVEVGSNRKSTERQKAAVHFCEQWLNITFEGNINSFSDVSAFLSLYLEDAKDLYEEAACDYEAYINTYLND